MPVFYCLGDLFPECSNYSCETIIDILEFELDLIQGTLEFHSNHRQKVIESFYSY